MEPANLWITWFVLMCSIRLLTVFISKRNENRLKKIGAVEYGKLNSVLLIITHFAFYFLCILEGHSNGVATNEISVSGIIIFTISIAFLYYVIYELKNIWTVKLLIASPTYHQINKSFIFKYVKHPNYYLNIIPELVALTLIFQAWLCLAVGLPLYTVLLIIRIRQEESIMRQKFRDY